MNRFICLIAFLFVFLPTSNVLGQTPQMRVGPNVHVSKAHENYSLGEILLTADPTDPNRLLGCGVVYAESENRRWTTVYVSADGGKSWDSTLETKTFEDSADPACALGRNGLATHITIGVIDKDHYGLGLYRSTDAGKTWVRQDDLPMKFQGIDRESIVVDTTQGKYANRVYITGESTVRDLGNNPRNGFAIWRSRNGGSIFEGPWKRPTIANRYVLEPGNSVVLSDGTLVCLFGDLKDFEYGRNEVSQSTPTQSNAVLESVSSKDGGDSFTEAVKVDDFFMAWGTDNLGDVSLGMPTLAADTGDGPFRDSLYATWGDERNGRADIRIAYSRDKGKTWSKSVVIDDVPGPLDESKGPYNFLPTVAVNKAGVVVVSWYDRRENPDGLGWYVRARASLDGGETWLPSVRVSEEPNTFSPSARLFTATGVTQAGGGTSAIEMGPEHGGTGSMELGENDSAPDDKKEATRKPTQVSVSFQGRQFYAGDYAGLAADAGGTFHAFWIDNRTGLQQIWTAPISVDGKAIANGSDELSGFKDVSKEVELKVVSSSYDRASHIVTLGVQIKNPSKIVIHGPIKLRLVDITSPLGSPSAVNADNHVGTPGAVWDLTSLLKDNILIPEQTSATTNLVFHVDHPRELLANSKNVRYQLLKFDVRLLATSTEPSREAATTSSDKEPAKP